MNTHLQALFFPDEAFYGLRYINSLGSIFLHPLSHSLLSFFFSPFITLLTSAIFLSVIKPTFHFFLWRHFSLILWLLFCCRSSSDIFNLLLLVVFVWQTPLHLCSSSLIKSSIFSSLILVFSHPLRTYLIYGLWNFYFLRTDLHTNLLSLVYDLHTNPK